MPQLVTGIYADPSVARSAMGSLKTYGFADSDIIHLAPAADQRTPLLKLGVSPADTKILATGLGPSGTLVAVRPPFGHALRIERILQSYQGAHVKTWLTGEDIHRDVGNDAAPFSRILGLPTLTNNAWPFSRWLKLPLLSGGFLSARLGWKLLSFEPAPLSRATGLKTLSHEAAPFSRLLGWKTLSDNPAPLSNFLGIKTLS